MIKKHLHLFHISTNFTFLCALMCIYNYMSSLVLTLSFVFLTSVKLPLIFMVKGNSVKDETSAFESWQTNRLEWQYLWHKLSLRWPEIWWQFQKKSIKPSTFLHIYHQIHLGTVQKKKKNSRDAYGRRRERVMDYMFFFFLLTVVLLFFLRHTGNSLFLSVPRDLCKDWFSFTCNLFNDVFL